jgi:hypothetical protein
MVELWRNRGLEMTKKRWRFGVEQTAREGPREVAAAQRAGRSEEDVAGQRRARLVAAETARRRARHARRAA